ncbi:hypothetical protein, conserved [Leishmania donovani]|uniref:Complex 1 protein (LYR family) protein n=1 Tax=Leishmania donovani TaxID=5661 RepID=A0A3Q8IJR9_LEIDO|nr:hypothetical protein, conserved [Leishmania donovani]AYU78049.1 Complex 1 protein (LYR family)/Complex1 LYR-like, putative [Leishmania donovani]TPP50562.1 Complex 1 protein (LYR family) protein [Leishmania donovani]CBZ33427.1 hypothetical protein, conserved [Leishmania donovani]
MRECLHLTHVVRHKRHDKGGNAHNFAFDTLTKVYRDAVYLPQEKYRRGLMHPERSRRAPPSQAALVAPSSSSDVTNHVGNIGVMSSVATKLSDRMAQQHHQKKLQTDEDGGTDHAFAKASCATPIAGRSVVSSSSSPAHSAAAATTEESYVDDEAIRRRLRAHLFSNKMQSGQPCTAPSTPVATASASPRRSGVQAEILSVYRSMLREVSRMQDADTRRSLSAYIRQEYDKQRDIPRKNITKIEWRLNYGKRKLEELQAMSKHTKFTMMR